MKEKHQRSIAKTITWRIIATLTTVALVFLFTGELAISLGVGVLDVIIKLLFYYIHERAWDSTNWGRTK